MFSYFKMHKAFYSLVILHVKQCHESDGDYAKEARAPLEEFLKIQIFNLNERPCVSVPIE